MNYLAEYFSEIESGKAIVSESIRIVYTKLMHEAQHSDIWVFDEAKGEHAINFIETFCKQSKGRWYSKPMELLLFQKAFIQVLFGFVDEPGLRRFQETLLLIARKNGKSTLLAGIGLYMLMADGEGGAEVYSIASKKDQARLVFTEAVNMISQSQLLLKRLKKRKSDLYFDGTKSKFAPLASDSNTLDGLNSHCVIIDDRFLPLLYELDSEEEWQDKTWKHLIIIMT